MKDLSHGRKTNNIKCVNHLNLFKTTLQFKKCKKKIIKNYYTLDFKNNICTFFILILTTEHFKNLYKISNHLKIDTYLYFCFKTILKKGKIIIDL